MAMGLPSVATNVGDATILAGDAAVLVAPRDERALARGLTEVLALSRVERRRLGERARQRVEAEFSIARAAGRFAALYQDVLREAGR
jgi:glycosyltransferase involved in cell wall biosynthesis